MTGRAAVVEAIRLDGVEEERIRWRWPGRAAEGKLTDFGGDPGEGKSTLGLYVVACMTNGRALPGGERGEPTNVGIISDEDGLADTIVPRLRLAGADLSRVYQVIGRSEQGHKRSLLIPDDTNQIIEAVRRLELGHLHIDPLAAHAGASVKLNNDQDVRAKIMGPLANVAEETGALVTLVRHLNKMVGGKAMYRGGGSIGIIGAARFGLMVGRHPKDRDLRVLASVKCNIGPEPPSLAYRLEGVPGSDHARLVWHGVVDLTADDLVSPPQADDGEGDEVKDWLRDVLRSGRVKAVDVFKAAEKVGYREGQVKRAKGALRVKSEREGFGAGSVVWWSLPIGNGTILYAETVPMDSMDPMGSDAKNWHRPTEAMAGLWRETP